MLIGHASIYPYGNDALAQGALDQVIEHRIAAIPPSPEYLYSADTVRGAISTVWMDVTGKVLGTKELRDKYDEFYFAALGYRSMATRAIFRAKRALGQGNTALASELVAAHDRYMKLFNLSVNGAFAAFDGNSSAASTFAKGIYDGCSASVKFGSSFVLGSASSLLVDIAADGFDILANMPDVGLAQAQATFLRKALIDVVFDSVPLSELGGKTLSESLGSAATKVIGSSGLYQLLDSALHSPQFEKGLMKVLAEAGKTATVDQAKALVEKMLDDMATGSRTATVVTPSSSAGSPTTIECKEPVVKAGLSGSDAGLALGPANDYYRADAIEALVKGERFRVPQCGAELGITLTGATGEHRARAIKALVSVIKSNLSGEEGAAILGTSKECSEYYRADAVTHLARGKKFKADLSGKELEMILDGTTGEHRARAIAAISASYK